jgi:hypothetical protein
VPRLWRCGNRGNVASVLIEKPPRGDFLPLLEGGYSLQYSPLLEHRLGRGLILFCQVDVTGRTEAEPVAERLTRNLLQHLSEWKPQAPRTLLFLGGSAGKRHLERAGFNVSDFTGDESTGDHLLVIASGNRAELERNKDAMTRWLEKGGRVLALGLDQQDANAALPMRIQFKMAEHIATFFPPPPIDSPFAGISPADLHNRDPRNVSLVTGDGVLGNGILASANGGQVVFGQLIPWEFDPAKQMNLKRTFRRSAFALSRLLHNLGAASTSPIPERFHTPADATTSEPRWRDGLYLDTPEEWDDPYRFFRW